MILMREMSPGIIALATVAAGTSTPSMRNVTRMSPTSGSQ